MIGLIKKLKWLPLEIEDFTPGFSTSKNHQ